VKLQDKIGPLSFGKVAAYSIWWFCRNVRYLYYGMVNKFSPLQKFRRIGKGVKFNGRVVVELPCSDISIGNNCMIGRHCHILVTRDASLDIGDNVLINDSCYITACHKISIGNNVLIGEFVSIRDYNHKFDSLESPINTQGYAGAPISIEEDVWIGRGVIITAGVTIGKGSVIGANAVVTRSIPAFSVAAGIPAKVLRSRK
jgi:acetyltransferase-like isoleucine patch superfamily enzyme